MSGTKKQVYMYYVCNTTLGYGLVSSLSQGTKAQGVSNLPNLYLLRVNAGIMILVITVQRLFP